MKSNDLRKAFLDYFKRNGHEVVSSSRLIPENDPTLLFTNAGMNQFKNVFLGLETRPYKRAATSQKCVRAGGKHNDLENVGHTARHHTFFEMLGNFSFGDYFKKEAIHYAWEFLTQDLGIDKNRLYITVFETDDEAAEIWHKQENIPKDRIYRFGEKDNFWRMGNSGPCGPCSEIFYDFGPDVGGDPKENVMGGSGDRFVEIWNLVFMQYNEDESGNKTLLPKPSIDTGAGLERISTLMQGKLNNYDTDIFQSIINRACKISGKEYVENINSLSPKAQIEVQKINTALRVLADHSRSTAFLIADGVIPSNEGRGYVLRRIMRRAIRYGRTLSDSSLLPQMVDEVIRSMGGHYSELVERKDLVITQSKDEEERFLKTLDQGTLLLSQELDLLSKQKKNTLSGETAFKLYDTYGFPLDLTRLIAKENKVEVDEVGFESQMEKAKELSKSSWKGQGLEADQAHLIKITQDLLHSNGPTEFTGYPNQTQEQGACIRVSNGTELVNTLKTGEQGLVAFDKTCFYAESGGQIGDKGTLESAHGKAKVLNTLKQNDIHMLQIEVIAGSINVGDNCSQTVESSSRSQIANNHSATHLLHAALRDVLGPHIQQAGSLVEERRLRFDFTHSSPLTIAETQKIEDLVNQQIDKSFTVCTDTMSPAEAKEKGAIALFGEKYGSKVRVVQMGDFSMELCGGTHVHNTSEIGAFKIVAESGVSSGVRRIEAITGALARKYLIENTRENLNAKEASGLNANWQEFLKSQNTHALTDYIENQKNKIKQLEKEIQCLKAQSTNIDEFLKNAIDFSSAGEKGKLILADIPVDDRKVLSDLTDKLRDKAEPAVVVVVGQGADSHPVIVSVSKKLTKSVNAGNILKEMAQAMGGKGGGRPDFAQGAAPDRSKLAEAFKKAKEIISALH